MSIGLRKILKKEYNINIIEGNIININGKNIGTIFQDYKYGYHPAIKLQIGKKITWFELDEKDLINKIAEKVVEFYK
jgi:ABC-type ATPase involved in cell division